MTVSRSEINDCHIYCSGVSYVALKAVKYHPYPHYPSVHGTGDHITLLTEIMSLYWWSSGEWHRLEIDEYLV